MILCCMWLLICDLVYYGGWLICDVVLYVVANFMRVDIL